MTDKWISHGKITILAHLYSVCARERVTAPGSCSYRPVMDTQSNFEGRRVQDSRISHVTRLAEHTRCTARLEKVEPASQLCAEDGKFVAHISGLSAVSECNTYTAWGAAYGEELGPDFTERKVVRKC
jgi:hypothetical protein